MKLYQIKYFITKRNKVFTIYESGQNKKEVELKFKKHFSKATLIKIKWISL